MSKIKCLIILNIVFTSCGIFHTSTKKTFDKSIVFSPFDAIIVPGVPFNAPTWSKTMKMRVSWAYHLYKIGATNHIIFSGSSVYTGYRESTIMALYAESLGIPKSAIYEEQRAEHSTENVYYGFLVAKENGFKKLALATDPFQTNMLRSFIKKYELPVELLPVVWQTLSKLEMPTPNIDPSSAKVQGWVSLIETQSFWQRLKGTMGKNICWKLEDLNKKRFHRRYKERIEI